MKSLKNVLTVLAVIVAIGGAFATKKFSTTGWAHNNTVMGSPCEPISLSDDCQVRTSGTICTFEFDESGVNQNTYGTDVDCQNNTSSQLLRLPS